MGRFNGCSLSFQAASPLCLGWHITLGTRSWIIDQHDWVQQHMVVVPAKAIMQGLNGGRALVEGREKAGGAGSDPWRRGRSEDGRVLRQVSTGPILMLKRNPDKTMAMIADVSGGVRYAVLLEDAQCRRRGLGEYWPASTRRGTRRARAQHMHQDHNNEEIKPASRGFKVVYYCWMVTRQWRKKNLRCCRCMTSRHKANSQVAWATLG